MDNIKTWLHSRKGEMTGIIVKDNGEWLDIELTTEANLKYIAESSQHLRDREVGEVITVRKSFLTEIKTPTK